MADKKETIFAFQVLPVIIFVGALVGLLFYLRVIQWVVEFVAYADFGPKVKDLSHQTVVVVTFALAGFANFASIAIQIGAIGGLAPERRGGVSRATG